MSLWSPALAAAVGSPAGDAADIVFRRPHPRASAAGDLLRPSSPVAVHILKLLLLPVEVHVRILQFSLKLAQSNVCDPFTSRNL